MMCSFRFVLIILISFATGCSFFSSKIDTMARNKVPQSLQPLSKHNFCSDKNRLVFFTEDEATLKFYRELENSLFQKENPFIQKGILMALTELNRRPDLVSPSSRLQIYLKLDGKNYYYDFRPKSLEDDTRYSYIKGLDYLSKNFRQQSLSSMAGTLDSIIPQQIPVTFGFENFLKAARPEMQKNELMISRFFKGDETITRYETFHRMSFKNIINYFTSPQFMSENTYEFEKNNLIKQGSSTTITKCNVNLDKDNSLSDEILNSDNLRTNTFGLTEGENIFLAMSSAIMQRPLKIEKNFYFLKMRPNPFPGPVCEFSDAQKEIVLFSAKGRSPAQHLKHLLAYEVDHVIHPSQLNDLLKFSRHLFLQDPDRILYESKRGRKAQLDFFLAMNFPIYHVDSLGEVFGSISYTENKQRKNSLIIDDRNSSVLSCLK